MTIFLFLFLAYCFGTAKYYNPLSVNVNKEYLHKDNTLVINGLFVLFVFFTHFSQYVTDFTKIEKPYLIFRGLIGQCVVCTFLFYSGYGIMESMKKGKVAYCKKLLLKRFPSLLLKFDICVVIYVFYGLLRGERFSCSQILLSLIGLSSVGNSNWYIFYILISYIFIYISFRFVHRIKISFLLLFLFYFVYVAFFCLFNKENGQFYVTAFVLPVGILFSLYKEKLCREIEKDYVMKLIAFFGLFCLIFSLRWYISRSYLITIWSWLYNVQAVLFALLVVIVSIKVHFNNIPLEFLGKHVFEIYILQRLPMIFFADKINTSRFSFYVFFIISLMLTLFLAATLKIFFNKMHL